MKQIDNKNGVMGTGFSIYDFLQEMESLDDEIISFTCGEHIAEYVGRHISNLMMNTAHVIRDRQKDEINKR